VGHSKTFFLDYGGPIEQHIQIQQSGTPLFLSDSPETELSRKKMIQQGSGIPRGPDVQDPIQEVGLIVVSNRFCSVETRNGDNFNGIDKEPGGIP
jgi:hypothetical protein